MTSFTIPLDPEDKHKLATSIATLSDVIKYFIMLSVIVHSVSGKVGKGSKMAAIVTGHKQVLVNFINVWKDFKYTYSFQSP